MVALANLRIGNHELENERGRHMKKSREERLCTFCDKAKLKRSILLFLIVNYVKI